MTFEVTSAIAGGIIGAAITQIGNSLVQLSVRSWQRKQWFLENEKSEYRELLTGLSQSFRCILDNSTSFHPGTLITGDDRRKAYEAAGEGRRLIEDRIFISKMVEDENLLERWNVLTGERDVNRFIQEWVRLHEFLTARALKDLRR